EGPPPPELCEVRDRREREQPTHDCPDVGRTRLVKPETDRQGDAVDEGDREERREGHVPRAPVGRPGELGLLPLAAHLDPRPPRWVASGRDDRLDEPLLRAARRARARLLPAR